MSRDIPNLQPGEIMHMYDIIVVGGGPAGASAARAGARMGMKVLLIEKEMMPRYKPCGGALSERGRSYLDFRLPDDIVDAEIYKVRIHFKDRFAEISRSERLSTLVTRSVFDEMLVRKALDAGAEVLLGRRATDISEGDGFVTVMAGDAFRGRTLILAEGLQGALRKKMRIKNGTNGACLVTEIETGEPMDFMEMHFGYADMGYGWVFPHGSYLSVGVGGISSSLRSIMHDFMRSKGLVAGRLHGHAIPLSGPSGYSAGERVMLCGDSAGMVDPFTGEGIAYAIRSGQIAASVAAEYINGEADLSEYERRCKREFGDDLKASLLLARIMHRFPDQLFNLFIEERSLLERYMDIHAKGLSYRSFIRWIARAIPPKLIVSALRRRF